MADQRPALRPPVSPLHPFLGVSFLCFTFFCALFGFCGIIGPFSVLLFVDVQLYRRYCDFWLRTWLMLPGAIFELMCGTKIIITGDKVPPNEPTLIIMNHRCRLDWMFYWMVLLRNGNLQYEKIMLRDDLRHVPGAGWAIQSGLFIFLQRRWEKDEPYLKTILSYFKETKYPLQLLLFPEGTNMCKAGKARSDAFATKNNLRDLTQVLHPRVRGFTFVLEQLRGSVINSVQDVTIAYNNSLSFNELDLLKGHFPGEIHVNIKRHKLEDMPTEEKDLEEWCKQRWDEKEDRLIDFYQHGKFNVKEADKPDYKMEEFIIKLKLIGILLFWILYLPFVIYIFWTSWLFRTLCLMITLFHIVVGYMFGGVDLLFLMLYQKQYSAVKQK